MPVNGERHGLILRRDPPTAAAAEQGRAPAVPRPRHRIPRAGRRLQGGVRAPEVLFELTPQDGLGEAYVMRRIGGTAIARKLLRDRPYEKAREP